MSEQHDQPPNDQQPTVSEEELTAAQHEAEILAEEERAHLSTVTQGTPSGVVPQDLTGEAGGEEEPDPVPGRRRARAVPEDRPWEQDDPAKPFKVGTWSGKPNYICREPGCGWATLRGAARAIQHYYDKHAPPEEVGQRSLLVGPNGEPLTVSI